MLPTITVDVGTTSVKLCFFDAEGELLASARHATPTVTEADGENYELDVLRGLVSGFIRDLEPGHRAAVRRIAFTGVGESGGLVRPDLSLASPMILWHDHRGAGSLARLDGTQRALVYGVTGLPVNANYGLSKAAWAFARLPGSLDGAQWLNVSEYLAATLTGVRWSEYSLASRTMALDLRSGAWSAEVAALVGLGTEIFPPLRPATEGAPLTADVARELGLPAGIEVHVAGHDHMVGAIGADLQRGELLNSTGTTEGLLFVRDAPDLGAAAEHAKLANGISSTGSEYTLFASIPTGGSAFATLQGMLGLDAAQLTARIDDLHRRYVAGSLDPRSAPLVLPQFRGSPPPTKNAAARGMIAGLGSEVSSDDLILGCFLGLVLQFRDVLDLFPDRPERVKVIGPASRNPLWLQLKADLLGTQLSVSRFPEVVSRGAQALASGVPSSWAACRPVELFADDRRTAVLEEWSRHVRPLWEHMKAAPS